MSRMWKGIWSPGNLVEAVLTERFIRSMGYRQNIIVSSQLDQVTRERTIDSAIARWPFLRHARQENAFLDQLLLAPPESTEYLFDNDTDYWTAIEQNEQ